MYKDVSATFRVSFSRQSCEGRGVRGGRAPKKPARSRPPRPRYCDKENGSHSTCGWMGLRQCAGGLFWLGHFLCPLLFPPTHPPENPTRAARHREPARQGHPLRGASCGQTFPKPCPPLYGESGARRLRPRAHCLCGVAPCSGASAALHSAGKEAARRTMRQTQAARLAPRQLGPQFPQLPPLPGRGLRENPRALTPRLAPQKIQHSGILASPFFFCRGVAGLANMPEYWGAGRGVAPAG